MRFEAYICHTVAEAPEWCNGAHLEVVLTADDEGEMPVVIARRHDGDVQVVPHAAHDPEVVVALLRWAARVDE